VVDDPGTGQAEETFKALPRALGHALAQEDPGDHGVPSSELHAIAVNHARVAMIPADVAIGLAGRVGVLKVGQCRDGPLNALGRGVDGQSVEHDIEHFQPTGPRPQFSVREQPCPIGVDTQGQSGRFLGRRLPDRFGRRRRRHKGQDEKEPRNAARGRERIIAICLSPILPGASDSNPPGIRRKAKGPPIGGPLLSVDRGRSSASRTGSCGGPWRGRTSCARRRANRGSGTRPS